MDIFEVCQNKLKEKGLLEDKKYKRRFIWESEEIKAKGKIDYFQNLFDKKIKYPKNENNLLICWLLGIVEDFDIEKHPKCKIDGDWPDVDIDYLPIVRDYLKTEWAPKTFGQDYVCNIGNYATFKLKSSLLDMARVHGESHEEIQALTKELEDKDDEGESMTWDSAMRLYPDLKKYCEDHPDVADAAHRLLGRNRGTGVHAAGLIIANGPLKDFVPLIKRKDAHQASAWTEGLNSQDLQPVGLIKFDLLVISNLLQIALCCEMVKKRYKLDGICNRPGLPDWSDTPKWRNDPKALAMANAGDMKCIFQFDSEGIRGLVRAGGVDRFEDLVAYAALFRPGPLGMKMHERYVERKRGREKYVLHPLVKPILEKTYGVISFQEQIMKILNIVGDIPLKDCEILRKAISKKKIEGFIKYKEIFIINGQKNLGVSEEEMKNFWDQIESFSEYGFNLSHAVAYTYISQWLLYLKAHYPHEFYTSILSCEKLSEKIKEYKMEAKLHSVDMHRLDINSSGVTFELKEDNLIYFGFSNVKGIGEAPAKRIVENQPYKNFEDFLHKFGTDASVLKPVLGLRCFKERDPVTLWKFSEAYKDALKKTESKKKNFAAAMIRYENEFKELLPNESRQLSDFSGENPFKEGNWAELYSVEEPILVDKEVECEESESTISRWVIEDIREDDFIVERETLKFFKIIKVEKTWNRYKELLKLWTKRKKSINGYQSKENEILPSLTSFDPNLWEIDDELLTEFRDPVACELKYYGFAWVHELERSPDFRGLTFDALKGSGSPGPVEVKILKVVETKSKKGNTYYQMFVEDVTGSQTKIMIWIDDWNRWQKEFTIGNLIRLRLQPPSGGFNSFLLESNQVGKYRNQIRYREKEDDPRVYVMKPSQKIEEKFLTDEEALEQFSNCIME